MMRSGDGKLKQRIKDQDLLLGGCVMDLRSGAVIEAYSDAGLDFVMVDREHTGLNSETILEHIRLARALGLPCVVRVAEASYAELNRTLDQLPDGIFVPRVRTREEVEKIVEMIKYPPLGKRGVGASTCPAGRYIGWGSVKKMITSINDHTMIGIQIETREALENLDEILSVPGIDVAVVGNDDLSTGMGIPGEFASDEYRDAVRRVIKTCQKYGVMPGIAGGDPEWVKYWSEEGMRMFWVVADIVLVWQGVHQTCRKLHNVLNLPGLNND